MMTKRFYVLIAASLTVLAGAATISCNGPGSPGAQDTPTSGTVAVSVDETFAPILQAQVDTFAKLYPSAHIRMSFEPEEKVMLDLINDKVKVAVVSRELNAGEKADFAKHTIVPRTDRKSVV